MTSRSNSPYLQETNTDYMYERGRQGGTIQLSNRPHFLWIYRRDDPQTACWERTREKLVNHEPSR